MEDYGQFRYKFMKHTKIRYMLSDGTANQSLTQTTGEEDYPNTRILGTYSLEFLDLPNNYSEKDLKKEK